MTDLNPVFCNIASEEVVNELDRHFSTYSTLQFSTEAYPYKRIRYKSFDFIINRLFFHQTFRISIIDIIEDCRCQFEITWSKQIVGSAILRM